MLKLFKQFWVLITKDFLIIDMIYVKKDKEKIYFTTEFIEGEPSLYTLDWDIDRLIYLSRPWKYLGDLDNNFYKPSIIEEFFEVWKFNQSLPSEHYDNLSKNLLDETLKLSKELESWGLISPILPVFPEYQLQYNCDILNLLEDYYGESGLSMIQEYIDLDTEEKTALRELYKFITKEKRIEYLKRIRTTVSLPSIVNFLPPGCKDFLKVFGVSDRIESRQNCYYVPEFKKEDPLGGRKDEAQIRLKLLDEIYKEFEIGSVLRGSDIRARFRKIYQKYGFNPKATLVDFSEYFVLKKTRSDYEWYYRLMRRRKDEVLAEIKKAYSL